jgi:hypothetical protein
VEDGGWNVEHGGLRGRASRVTGKHATVLLLLLLYSRTGPRRALSLKLSDTRVYEPEIRTTVRGNMVLRLPLDSGILD